MSADALNERHCVVCGEPMRSLTDVLVLNDDAVLSGPLAELPTNYLVHLRCCRFIGDRGYCVSLSRIVKRGDPTNPYVQGGDSLSGWTSHLSGKAWFTLRDAKWLHIAHREAVRLNRIAKAESTTARRGRGAQ